MKSTSILLTENSNSDAHIALVDANGVSLSQADLWWKETPVLEGNRVGAIGAFTAVDFKSTQQLLSAATAHLKSLGVHLAVGPMDQNTWKKHRFVVESNGRASFLLEPENCQDYPDWWLKSDFDILSYYSSSIVSLDGLKTVSSAMKERILSSGIRIDNFDLTKFDEELHAIHALSLESFSKNFLYAPLEFENFIQAYQKIRDHIDTELVKLARRGDDLVGFVFGIPDLAALSRNEKPALIVKTLAVDPHAQTAGLGSLLVDELHQVGIQKGFHEAIHALQHESNTSKKITGRYNGSPFRRYALFSKNL